VDGYAWLLPVEIFYPENAGVVVRVLATLLEGSQFDFGL
jgi:hypothetical protein